MLTHRKMCEMDDGENKTVDFGHFLEKMGMDDDQLVFPATKAGQYQLTQWLGKTFGAGYRTNKFAKAMLSHFEKHVKAQKFTS